jgi:hypothetical protein
MRPVASFALLALLAITVVYLTVWPHELGHASVAWLYGCKADPWRTDTHWYLAGSRAGAVDQKCLAQWGGEALGVMALSGTGVNLLLLALAPLLGRWWLPGRTARGGVRWGLVATLLWALANAAEALSYLVINTVWLKTDMALVAQSGLGRGCWTFAGLVLGTVIVRGLRSPLRKAAAALATPRRTERFWRWTFAGYALAVGLAAVASRAFLA